MKVKQMEAFLWVIPLSWYLRSLAEDFLLRASFSHTEARRLQLGAGNSYPRLEIGRDSENRFNYIVKRCLLHAFIHKKSGKREENEEEQPSTDLWFIHKIYNEFRRTRRRWKVWSMLEVSHEQSGGKSFMRRWLSVPESSYLGPVAHVKRLINSWPCPSPEQRSSLHNLQYIVTDFHDVCLFEHDMQYGLWVYMQLMQISTPKSSSSALGKEGERESNSNIQTPRM